MMCNIEGCWNDAEYYIEIEETDVQVCEEHSIKTRELIC